MERRSALEQAAVVEGGRRLDASVSSSWHDRGAEGRDRHPLEDRSTFSVAASIRSFNLLCQLLDEEQLADLFEYGFAIESTRDATFVLDLVDSGLLAVEHDRLVQFCIDPDIDVPRLDRLATKLVWARGDWKGFRSEAVPLDVIDEDEMEERLDLSGPQAIWSRAHYGSLRLLSRLVSWCQLEGLGAGRVAITREPFVFVLGGKDVAMLDSRDGSWSRLGFTPKRSDESWSTYWLRHVIAVNDPFGYMRSACRTEL